MLLEEYLSQRLGVSQEEVKKALDEFFSRRMKERQEHVTAGNYVLILLRQKQPERIVSVIPNWFNRSWVENILSEEGVEPTEENINWFMAELHYDDGLANAVAETTDEFARKIIRELFHEGDSKDNLDE